MQLLSDYGGSSQEGIRKGVATVGRCNQYLNPYEGAKAVVAEAARNLSCVGAEPLAVTDNLNFGSPEKTRWLLAAELAERQEACRELGRQ